MVGTVYRANSVSILVYWWSDRGGRGRGHVVQVRINEFWLLSTVPCRVFTAVQVTQLSCTTGTGTVSLFPSLVYRRYYYIACYILVVSLDLDQISMMSNSQWYPGTRFFIAPPELKAHHYSRQCFPPVYTPLCTTFRV